jgi:two-component system OmpR family response regulator
MNAPSPRVFVIDDSDISRELIGEILSEHGFEVESSESPFDLSGRLGRFRPDIILLDLRMPGMTEDKLPHVISLYRAACDARVLLHSAHDRVEVMRIVKNAGADGSIEKTDDDATLVERVKLWMNRRR